MVQLLDPEGRLTTGADAERYGHLIDALDDATLQQFWRDMVVGRTFDRAAANMQRQGQLALWIPSQGQEAAQVGSAYATRAQDHIFRLTANTSWASFVDSTRCNCWRCCAA